VFYKLIFARYGIGIWLAWLASILALVSTAGIFPDLINSGSIHLLISKPIGRLRLFFTQYGAGLLFVCLQVALFTLACFLVIGLRGGAWEPSLFMAVPVVLCFFSYLFSVCVLLGLLTRSTLAALLLTMLFWFFTFGVGVAENILLVFRTQEKYGNFPPGAAQVERPQNPTAFAGPAPAAKKPAGEAAKPERGGKLPRAMGRALTKAVAEPSSDDKAIAKGPEPASPKPTALNPTANQPGPPPTAKPEEDQKEPSAKLKLAYDMVYGLKTILPKTSETIGVLERCLYDMADLPEGLMGRPREQQKAERELVETLRNRPVWWIIGTSLGFEAVVLCGAAWVFCRRDY
jgi:hypothetical protein